MADRTTLRDVAARAGVSTATASLVLNGRRARISDATRDRVRAAATDLGYRPNRVAHGLVTRRTATIALVSDALASDPFTGPLVRGAESAARAAGHLLYIAEAGDAPGDAHALVERLLDQGVDGIVYATTRRRAVPVPRPLREVPTVLLNCTADDAGDAGHGSSAHARGVVLPDDEQAGRLVARHLLASGHTDRIHLVGEVRPNGPSGLERLDGITAELRRAGHELAAHHAVPWWPGPVRSRLDDVLASPTERPTAVVTMNDRTALGVYEAASRRGLAVPGDVSVVSFDDSFLAGWLDPGLTSAALPYAEMGRLAVRLVLGADPAAVHRLPFTLTARASSGPVRS